MPSDYTHTCECGRVWNVHQIKQAMRDKDSADCLCGREVVNWNGGCMYRITEINPKAAK